MVNGASDKYSSTKCDVLKRVYSLYFRNISKCILRNPPELIRKANKTIRCKAFNLSIICVNRKAMNQVEAKETLNVC
jgi:hypothetical protein